MRNRKIIIPNWIPKNGKKPLRVEIIEPEDLEVITNFYNQHFVNHGNLWQSIKITPEECKPLSYNAMSFALRNPVSFAAYESDRLVGIQINRLHSPEEFPKLFNGELHSDNPTVEIKDDYAEDIQNGPYYNLQANRIHVFQEIQKQAGKFLPKTLKNLGFFKSAAVIPEYQGSGIAGCLGNESIKLFAKYQCEYIMGVALVDVVHQSTKMLGMKLCFEIPFSNYKENGKPVFEDLAKKGQSMKILIGKLEDAMKFVENFEKQQQSKNKSALSKI